MNPRSEKSLQTSFTLVELMAAMAVLSLLMVAMVTMFDQAMRGWQSAQRGIDARREVRAALQLLEGDLRNMYVGGQEITVITTNLNGSTTTNIQTNRGRPIFITPDSGDGSSRLTFLTALATNAQETNNPGDLCVVQYYVNTNTNGAYRLFRVIQPSRATFSILLNNPNISSVDQLLGAGTLTEELAVNVIYFRAELKRWVSNNLAIIERSSLDRPDLIQLELTAYSQQKAQSFKTTADWKNTSNIQKFGKTYLWRVAP